MKKDISEFNYMWSKIESSFDWNMVRNLMEFLDWNYNGTTITVKELKECANRVLLESFLLGEGSISSGGFVGECTGDGLHLSFVVEEVFTEDF
jgi:hypothetical protein